MVCWPSPLPVCGRVVGEHGEMHRRLLEAGELQPGIDRLLLAGVARQRPLVGVGEAFRRPPAVVRASSTCTKRQGWLNPTDGAWLAISISASMRSRATGSGRKRRTSRRHSTRSRNCARNGASKVGFHACRLSMKWKNVPLTEPRRAAAFRHRRAPSASRHSTSGSSSTRQHAGIMELVTHDLRARRAQRARRPSGGRGDSRDAACAGRTTFRAPAGPAIAWRRPAASSIPCAQHHVATAFAVDRDRRAGQRAQPVVETTRRRQCSGMQLGIAAGQPDHIGARDRAPRRRAARTAGSPRRPSASDRADADR